MSRNRNNLDKLYENKRKEIQNMIRLLDDKIYNLETVYLTETSNYGNVLVGWESYFNSKFLKSNAQVSNKKTVKIQDKDRLFSLASLHSKASENIREEREKNMNSSNYETNSHTGLVKKRIKKRNRDKGGEGNKRGPRKNFDYEEDEDYSLEEKAEKSRKKSKGGKDSSTFRENKLKNKKKKNKKKH